MAVWAITEKYELRETQLAAAAQAELTAEQAKVGTLLAKLVARKNEVVELKDPRPSLLCRPI